MNCPECDSRGVIIKSKRNGEYRKYECRLGHRWTVGAKPWGRPRGETPSRYVIKKYGATGSGLVRAQDQAMSK